ncbi:MAG TPA: 2'-5' RNA ligase family protein [Pseudomonadales bacterium]|nr:2'-5' RNA ligase family protein [Pseudomonadales bacterium]
MSLVMQAHPFLAQPHTIQNVRRDFVEWHRGRPHYFLWAIDVDLPHVRERLRAAEKHLSGYLLESYLRQPHITLSVCGFPARETCMQDEFPASLWTQQIRRISESKIASFEISIGGLSSFSSAPYLTVRDDTGSLARLRSCLHPDALQSDHDSYAPHVTVGLYRGVFNTRELALHLDQFEHCEPIAFRVEKISLMYYESAHIGGPLAIDRVICI